MGKLAEFTGASLLAAVAVLGQFGCEEPSTTQVIGAVNGAVNADIYVGGKRMIWKRSVPQSPPLDVTALQARSAATSLTPTPLTIDSNTPNLPAGPLPAEPTIDSMSVDELAEALRPLMLANGQEYQGAEPDYETARALKSHKMDGAIGHSSAVPTALAASAQSQIARTPLVAKTTDVRQPVDNLAYPAAENAAIVTFVDGNPLFLKEGSATIIGPHTAISAAHGFYDLTNHRWNTFGAGFVAPSGTIARAPYGYFNKHNCMTITISSNYPAFPNTEKWDFAVLDFAACSGDDNPSYYVGYIGYWWGWASNATSSDVLAVLGSPDPAANCSWPQECGMTGSWSTVSGWSVQSTQIFTGEGQSGVSWTLQSDDIYHVATHVASSTTGTQFNYALGRVFDGVMYGYCHTLDPSRFP